jgi:hypothetical protein
MSKYNLLHVKKFDSISMRLHNSQQLSVVNGYLYFDSDKLGVYAFLFFSQNAIDDYFEERFDKTPVEDLIQPKKMEELARKYASIHFIPWASIAHIQLH